MFRKIEMTRRGSTLALFVFGLAAFLAMVALAVDMGWVYNRQRQWQNAVTAAAIAGYQQLRQDEQDGSGVAQLGLLSSSLSNDCATSAQSSLVKVSGAYSSSAVVQVMKAYAQANGFTLTDGMITLGPDRVMVDGQTPIPLFVAPMYGLPSVNVRGTATVINGKLSANQSSLVPLAMPHGDVLDLTTGVSVAALPPSGFTPGKEYILKLGLGGDNRNRVLVPLDGNQSQPLLAYGAAYWALGTWTVEWLIDYRGGSFLFPDDPDVENKLLALGVNYQVLHVDPCSNTDEVSPVVNAVPRIMDLFVKPRIQVYSSENNDPVMVILQKAQIPYGNYQPALADDYNALKNTYVFDSGILTGALNGFDWLHCHHEDFTGQSSKNSPSDNATARQYGYPDVLQLKQAVAYAIRGFVQSGHHLFAECYATETFDESLAQRGQRLHYASVYSDCLAFTGFDLNNPQINSTNASGFYLPDATNPLQQDSQNSLPGWGGLTTAFNAAYIKSNVTRMGTVSNTVCKYLSGQAGTGTFTFLGGHQPAADIGERLVLDNVLLGSQSPSALSRQQMSYGPVDLDPSSNVTGSSAYQSAFSTGFSGTVAVGDTLRTELGNLVSPTRTAVSLRWSADPGATWQSYAANSPRVVTVPLVEQNIYGYTTADTLNVVGLAQFLLENVPNQAPQRTDNGPVKVGQVRGVFLRYVAKP